MFYWLNQIAAFIEKKNNNCKKVVISDFQHCTFKMVPMNIYIEKWIEQLFLHWVHLEIFNHNFKLIDSVHTIQATYIEV